MFYTGLYRKIVWRSFKYFEQCLINTCAFALLALLLISQAHYMLIQVCISSRIFFVEDGYDFRWNTSVYDNVKGEYSTVSINFIKGKISSNKTHQRKSFKNNSKVYLILYHRGMHHTKYIN